MKLEQCPTHALLASHMAAVLQKDRRAFKDDLIFWLHDVFKEHASELTMRDLEDRIRWDFLRHLVEVKLGTSLIPVGSRNFNGTESEQPWKDLPGARRKCVGYALPQHYTALANAYAERRYNGMVGTFESVKALTASLEENGVALSLPVALSSLSIPRIEHRTE